ncbi:hypothetical protein GOBAR_AA00149 [Gossypium barbadense]|uniref:Uncharacterized protein n=1 Tax=Gossypium barbadense TaxID=3634 RepID=A0A2P5YXZ3_GOSBA|nr:hypothetical protein GOBAR_AA00149 [Gossypium barbadense]
MPSGDVKGVEVNREGDDEGVECDGEGDLESVEFVGEGDVGGVQVDAEGVSAIDIEYAGDFATSDGVDNVVSCGKEEDGNETEV